MGVVVFGVGQCGGCGFFFFFFFVYDRCLKGLWVVVGSGVWVVAEVSCWSWISEASHDLSLISHCGSASWVWIDGLGSVDRWVDRLG